MPFLIGLPKLLVMTIFSLQRLNELILRTFLAFTLASHTTSLFTFFSDLIWLPFLLFSRFSLWGFSQLFPAVWQQILCWPLRKYQQRACSRLPSKSWTIFPLSSSVSNIYSLRRGSLRQAKRHMEWLYSSAFGRIAHNNKRTDAYSCSFRSWSRISGGCESSKKRDDATLEIQDPLGCINEYAFLATSRKLFVAEHKRLALRL